MHSILSTLRERHASVYAFAVFREPFSQLLSEIAYFPSDFAKCAVLASCDAWCPESLARCEPLIIPKNNFVCSSRALVGACPTTVCNVSYALGLLATLKFSKAFE